MLHKDDYLPPTKGKFFYQNFNHFGDGKYDANIKVGDMEKNPDMPVWISSQEHHIAIFTEGCEKCDVTTSWESLDSTRP